MARLSNASLLGAPAPGTSFDRLSSELGQLLARLQQTVLHSSPERERRLRTNEYERGRLQQNIDHARTTLTKLEHDALTLLAPGRRADVQADLNRKRELLELLMDRLQDLQRMAVDDDESSEGEDLLADIVPTPSDSMGSTTEDTQPDTPSNMTNSEIVENTHLISEPEEPAHAAGLLPETHSIDTTTQTSSTLRARTSGAQSPQPTSHTTARAVLFANRRRPGTSAAGPETSTATAEAILDQQAAEREDLADKVFLMAKAMKQQQQSIADSLDSEKDVLSRATEGMERAGRGMEAAKGRMGALQRMTEGKGWWGRIMLYAWVYGLMVALVLLVFVMPKLRF